ncbi:MAG: hypothetical protein LQ348_006937 [Seirophora lacunosa]|nr:MAG: hypothetical protein LQ348_006937 [Seirophora lacunosa]
MLLTALAVVSVAWSMSSNDQVVLSPNAEAEKYLIETAPGQTRWIEEDEKWALRREGVQFMDITGTQDLGQLASIASAERAKVIYPEKPVYNETLNPMMKELSKKNMKKHLEKFTSFYTRYYKSSYGAESSAWLLNQVNKTINESGAAEYGAFVKAFPHPWGQSSVIATIPGRSDKTVVIGAHQDSINLFLPSILAAPGADDDGSGTVTILEALRVLLQSDSILQGNASNTIEFQWYSAEEGGLLGSQAIFSAYEKSGRDVKAMLQQDMTGYIHKTLEAGEKESVGVITDFVNAELTEFIKKVVIEAGYPSAFVIESDFKYSDNKIHTTEDKIEYLSFDHMLQHARLTLGLAYELAFADFE